MLVNMIRLVLRMREGAVLISAAVSRLSAKGPFVYVAKGELTAELRSVALGQGQEDLVVDQRLAAGERVVVTGARRSPRGSPAVPHPARRFDPPS